MATWQEQIIKWRFSNSLPHRILGFVLKAGIELTTLAVPIGVFIVVLTTVVGISITDLAPLPSSVEQPRTLSWIVLTAVAWARLRCFTTDGLEYRELDPESEAIQVHLRR